MTLLPFIITQKILISIGKKIFNTFYLYFWYVRDIFFAIDVQIKAKLLLVCFYLLNTLQLQIFSFLLNLQYQVIHQTSMGNTEFQVPNNVRQQWTHFALNGHQYAKNMITQQVFQFKILSKHEQASISALIQRSIYSIPKTPKVIMLSNQYNQFFVLIQQGYSTFPSQMSKINNYFQILQLIRNIVTVVQVLFKKYGGFLIKQEMISVNKNLDVLVWINEAKQKSQVELPIQHNPKVEQEMLQNLLSITQNYTNFNVFQHYSDHNFSAFLTIISQVIRCQILQCTQRPNSRIKRALTPEHPKSHRYEFVSKSPWFDHQSLGVNESMKMRATLKIPNFIKGIHDKKTDLLDGIDHKRTITRQVPFASERLKSNKDLHAKSGLNKISEAQSITFVPVSEGQGDLHHYSVMKKNNESNAKTCECLMLSGESKNIKTIQNVKKIGFYSEDIGHPIKSHQTSLDLLINPHSEPSLPLGNLNKNHNQCIIRNVYTGLKACTDDKVIHQPPKEVSLDNLCANFAESKCFQNDQTKISFVQEFQKEQREKSYLWNNPNHTFLPHAKISLPLISSTVSSTINEEIKRIIDF